MQIIFHLGRYLILLGQVFRKPEKRSIYHRQILVEMEKLLIFVMEKNNSGVWIIML